MEEVEIRLFNFAILQVDAVFVHFLHLSELGVGLLKPVFEVNCVFFKVDPVVVDLLLQLVLFSSYLRLEFLKVSDLLYEFILHLMVFYLHRFLERLQFLLLLIYFGC